jgi:dinuclear metal center YbgI/SA1388 family protein
MTIQHLINHLEQWAPLSLQESYDNSGLLVGSADQELTGVLIALDSTLEVVEEAIAKGCNLIIAHHPIIFSGLKRLTGRNYIEQTVIKAIQNNIAIYAIHTNLDNVHTGVNHMMAQKIGLQNCRILAPKAHTLMKLCTFVPTSHATVVRTALAAAGAGQLGHYKACSFTSTGEGRFEALEGAKPFVGTVQNLHCEEEVRIEVVVHKHLTSQVLKALHQSHPYEEVAYDLIALEQTDAQIGAGLIGTLEEPLPIAQFLSHLKQQFELEVIKYTPVAHKTHIKTVALCGGSGSFLLKNALQQQADLFITGDFKYHEFFDAEQKIIIADIGHYESEQFTSQLIYERLSHQFSDITLFITSIRTNPVHYFVG